MRIIAKAYGWPPSELYDFDLEWFSFWHTAAIAVIEGKY
jgi:hypothetical protein